MPWSLLPDPRTSVHTSSTRLAGRPACVAGYKEGDASSPWGCFSQMTKGIEHVL